MSKAKVEITYQIRDEFGAVLDTKTEVVEVADRHNSCTATTDLIRAKEGSYTRRVVVVHAKLLD